MPVDEVVRTDPTAAFFAAVAETTGGTAFSVDQLTNRAVQRSLVAHYARKVLASDVAAVQAVEKVIVGRTDEERTRILATLGHVSARAGHIMDSSLAPMVRSAAREHRIAPALITAAGDKIRERHGNRHFVEWVAGDPDGFARFAWSSALRAAAMRIWDRHWARVVDQLEPDDWSTIPLEPENDQRTGWHRFSDSSAYARDAGVTSLIASSLEPANCHNAGAWYQALACATTAPGALTWARHANGIREVLGADQWKQTNDAIDHDVIELVADLPRVVGIIGTLALGVEAADAAARASTVCAHVRAITSSTSFSESRIA